MMVSSLCRLYAVDRVSEEGKSFMIEFANAVHGPVAVVFQFGIVMLRGRLLLL